jgi:glycosyltransferase involved in cell wall biosynthesis
VPVTCGGATLRVLYLTHTPLYGGGSRSLLGLLRVLRRDQVAATVAGPAGELLERVAAEGLGTTVEVPAWHPRWSLVDAAGQLRDLRRFAAAAGRAADDAGADLIHANTWPAALGACWSGSGARLIWHARDLPVRRPVVRLLAARCAAAIAVSDAVRDLLVKGGFPPGSVDRVYNGLSDAEVTVLRPAAEVRAELGIPGGAPLVVTAGWLVPWKRHDLLVAAMPRVCAAHEGARLVVAGPEPRESPGRLADLRALAERLGVGDAVVLPGMRPDLADLMAAADVYAHAAEAEAFGRTVAEAMLLGRPVVVAGAGGPAELVEDGVTGLVVAPGSAEALAGGVLRLLDDPGLAERCGRAARERVRLRLSPERMVEGVLNVYWRVRAGDGA